jgi:hypothetical protein
MAMPEVAVYPGQVARVMASNGLRVREDVLFTDAKGRENERSRRAAEKVLANWKEVLPAILEKEEAVLYIVKHIQVPLSTFEQLTMSWQAYGMTGATLVLTNLRMLHFGLSRSNKWTRVLKSARWGDVTDAKVKGWLVRILDLRYLNGQKERYARLPMGSAKKVKDILAAVMPASRAEMTSVQGMASLCPDCRAVLTPGSYQCPQCGLPFKTEKTLLQRTLMMPGGGYFYSGMTLAGVFSWVGEGLFLLLAIWYAAMALRFLPAAQNEDGRIMNSGELWGVAGVFLVFVALHKLVEYRHALRRIRTFLPASKI